MHEMEALSIPWLQMMAIPIVVLLTVADVLLVECLDANTSGTRWKNRSGP